MCAEQRCMQSRADRYKRYVGKAKEEAKNGKILTAIQYLQSANSIRPTENLKARISDLKALKLSNLPNNGLLLPETLFKRLYDYQKEGVAFLYSLYRDGKKGGILADDMGLGKTIQVIAFLSGVIASKQIKTVLLIMPTTLVSNWEKEIEKWTPDTQYKIFHEAERRLTKDLKKIQKEGGIIISTYKMILNNWQQVSSYNGAKFIRDYFILDEAHEIKNPTSKTAQACAAIFAKNRVLLTGTSKTTCKSCGLYDFACQGTLLGTAKTFKMEYAGLPVPAPGCEDRESGAPLNKLSLSLLHAS
ncbi:DNA excision repair protein ERCC-6-like [Hyperolius riggenbachi]|uniref:DNA excision repair protein ERCC-6-like n=1 Tax=Hyperolius riggenbachi TaxID=752182 RepID=UPI0035A2AFA3